ncbi:Alpha-L-fucosidase 3 [Hibiscus syriacus]|uniref:Alpha-L-fucosidase 3 n=1 Tax=Hibiscus syriacus TaxID=106335 RepID=A0A6A2XSL7_HIBSY|nr:Alpha-L-fucosidase 3 [Hibiscus syriacus]
MSSDSSSTFFITIFALSLLNLAPIDLVLAKKPCQFPAIFNFGDSNSDTGGLSAAFGQAPPPNGFSFFGGPAGRYTDGRLVIDFIAESLGLPYLSAFLDAVGTNFSHGANFATAGSTVRPQNTTLHQSGFSPISLDVQYYEFNDFHRRSLAARKQGGVYEALMPKEGHFSNALYTFDIGQNDLTAGYFSNMSTDEVRAFVPDVLSQFQNIIQASPVGCLPYVMERIPVLAGQIDEHGCASPFNDVARFFNRGLKKTVEQLRRDLGDAAITYVDVYSVKYSLISEGRKHGFKQPLRTCCGHGGKYNYNKEHGCGSKINKHGKEVLVGAPCKDPSSAVIWDGVHFTQAANKFIFERIVDGSFSHPPTPLNKACYRN